MKFRELWKLSSTVYKEMSFQSIFSLRVGSSLPQRGKTDVKRLVKNARVNTLISKLLTTFFIAVFGFTVFLPMTNLVHPSTSSYVVLMGSVSAFLAVVMFLIVFMGLQVSTAFVSSKITDILGAMPLPKSEVSNIIFLCLLRMFDIPLVTGVAVFLAAYFWVGGSILGGLLALVAVAISEIFALALTIGMARFFYSRVAAGGGRSRWQTLTRVFFMIVWILPTFGAYIVISFAGDIVSPFTSITQSLTSIQQALVFVFPFSYGFLVSYATFFKPEDYMLILFSVGSSIVYGFLALRCFGWVIRTVRTIGGEGVIARFREIVKDTLIKPQIPWVGIIRKDLRIASRVPAFASLFLLPAMQTIVLALSFSSFNDISPNVTLGTLTGISLITLLLPPTLLSMEGLASAYTRSLPMEKRTLISAKTLLSVVTYLISLVVLLVVALILKLNAAALDLIFIYGGIHGLAISAGIMLELTLLTRKFWREGFAVGNIYSRLTTYILILVPGFIVAMAPIMVIIAVQFMSASLTLSNPFSQLMFLILAISEFLTMTAVVALQK